MQKFYLLTLLLIGLAACKGSKTIYDDKNITEKKLDKLIDEYSRNAGDSQLARQVRYAYDYLHAQKQGAVRQYAYGSQLTEKEKYFNALNELQQFYNGIRRSPAAEALLAPGNVGEETERARLAVTDAYYTRAEEWTAEDNWKTSRQAYKYLQKVQGWMPDYKDTRNLMRLAKEQSVVEAAILPIRGEGFYYPAGQFNNRYGAAQRLADQLANDLNNQYNSENYRVYSQNNYNSRNNEQPDWTVEPVWTSLRYEQPRTQQSQQQRSKQTEIGKDTSGRPIYKTLTATLTIFERVTETKGTMEIRIRDQVNDERISSNRFQETYRQSSRWATYTGDAGALSNADWELINAPRQQQQQTDERWLEEKLLEKLYSDLLNDIRFRLNQR